MHDRRSSICRCEFGYDFRIYSDNGRLSFDICFTDCVIRKLGFLRVVPTGESLVSKCGYETQATRGFKAIRFNPVKVQSAQKKNFHQWTQRIVANMISNRYFVSISKKGRKRKEKKSLSARLIIYDI